MTKIDPSILPFFLDETIYVIEKELISNISAADSEIEIKTEINTDHQLPKNEPSDSEVKLLQVIPKVHDVMIIVNEEESDFLDKESKDLLDNILKAVGLNLDTIHGVNLAKTPNFEAYLKENTAKKNILFCSEALAHFPNVKVKYELIQSDDSTFLHSDNLKELSAHVDKKKKLWASLQSLFLKN